MWSYIHPGRALESPEVQQEHPHSLQGACRRMAARNRPARQLPAWLLLAGAAPCKGEHAAADAAEVKSRTTS